MHPPFYTPDMYVSQDILPLSGRRPRKRRGEPPQRLAILPVTDWPPTALPARPRHADAGPLPLLQAPRLVVVPEPRHTWRDIMGRFLIRACQRMILRNGPS